MNRDELKEVCRHILATAVVSVILGGILGTIYGCGIEPPKRLSPQAEKRYLEREAMTKKKSKVAVKHDSLEPFRDVGGWWRWRLLAPNGRNLSSAEAYTSPRGCKDTIDGLIKRNPTLRLKLPRVAGDRKEWIRLFGDPRKRTP